MYEKKSANANIASDVVVRTILWDTTGDPVPVEY